jgi:peroxidase
MSEFLPTLIGNNNFNNLIGPYRYDVNADPTILIEFGIAAYRLGHPLINTPLKLMDNNGNVIRNLKLGEMFINPNLISNETIDQILNGLIRVPAK